MTTTLFNIKLTINMPDGGRMARQLLNFYLPDMAVDIQETAYKLCDSNEATQARKFAELKVKRADAWSNEERTLNIFALLSVSGEDAAFIQKVISTYMESFPDYLKKASGKYFGRAGFPAEISLQPTDWNAEVLNA
jgi:hypothetical protein